MMKLGKTNAQLKQMEVSLDAAQLGKQKAETKAALAKEKAEVSESEVKRIELTLSVVTEERDKLRNVVNKFKKLKNDDGGNETANRTLIRVLEICSCFPIHVFFPGKSFFIALFNLQEFESSLSKKDCFIAELESNLREQEETNRHQHVEIELLNERLNNEARRIKSLERESDRLYSEIAHLESKLGHGDFSSANMGVLRMVNTLAVDNEVKQTIEALQTELQRHRRNYKQLKS